MSKTIPLSTLSDEWFKDPEFVREYDADPRRFEKVRRFGLHQAEEIYHCTRSHIESTPRRKARKNLDKVLSECAVPAARSAETSDKHSPREWFEAVQSVKDDIGALVSPGEKFILVDDAQLSAGELVEGRRDIPFLEQGGEYCGPPPDDEVAIQEFERLRREGATFIIFAWPAFWWLDHYETFRCYLQSTFRLVVSNERLIAFHLRAQSSDRQSQPNG